MKIINSPIFITVLVLLAFFIYQSKAKPKVAGEMRAAYEELMKIAEDGASDAEKSKAIQEFAMEIGSQLRQGFSSGFSSKKDSKEKIFLDTKGKIVIKGLKAIKPKWSGREGHIFIVKNESDKMIKSLKLNLEYYKASELIDVENKWISEIKVLEAGAEFAVQQDRSFPSGVEESEYETYKSDELKIKISSFDIVE